MLLLNSRVTLSRKDQRLGSAFSLKQTNRGEGATSVFGEGREGNGGRMGFIENIARRERVTSGGGLGQDPKSQREGYIKPKMRETGGRVGFIENTARRHETEVTLTTSGGRCITNGKKQKARPKWVNRKVR